MWKLYKEKTVLKIPFYLWTPWQREDHLTCNIAALSSGSWGIPTLCSSTFSWPMSFSGRKVPAPLPLASPWTFYSLTKLALSAGSQVSPAGELGKALWNAGQGHAFYGNSCRLLMLPLSKAFPLPGHCHCHSSAISESWRDWVQNGSWERSLSRL